MTLLAFTTKSNPIRDGPATTPLASSPSLSPHTQATLLSAASPAHCAASQAFGLLPRLLPGPPTSWSLPTSPPLPSLLPLTSSLPVTLPEEPFLNPKLGSGAPRLCSHGLVSRHWFPPHQSSSHYNTSSQERRCGAQEPMTDTVLVHGRNDAALAGSQVREGKENLK